MGILLHTASLQWAVGSVNPSVHCRTAVCSEQCESFRQLPYCRGQGAVGLFQYTACVSVCLCLCLCVCVFVCVCVCVVFLRVHVAPAPGLMVFSPFSVCLA